MFTISSVFEKKSSIPNILDRKMKQQKQRDDKGKEIKEHRPTDTNRPSNLRPPVKTTQSKEAHKVDVGDIMEEDKNSPDKHVTLSRYIAFRIIF